MIKPKPIQLASRLIYKKGKGGGIPVNQNLTVEEILAQAQSQEDGLEGNVARTPEKPKAPSIESIRTVNYVSANINNKVENIIAGAQELSTFLKENQEEQADFVAHNQAELQKFMHSDLTKTYTKVGQAFNEREQLYAELVQKNVVSSFEMSQFKETVSYLPYNELIDKFKHTAPAATPLTPADVDNLRLARTDNFQIILDGLKADNKLTDQNVAELQKLGPKTDEQLAQAREKIAIKIRQHDITNNTNYFESFQANREKISDLEKQIDQYMEEYNRLGRGLIKQIEAIYDQAENQQIKQDQLAELGQLSGLTIKKGQVFYGEDWSNDPLNLNLVRPKNKKVEITDITFGGEEIKDKNGRVTAKPTFEPIIHLKAEAKDGSGRHIEEKMSASRFLKWLSANNIEEKFDSPDQLDKALGLEGDLKAGQEFQYDLPEGQNEDSDEMSFKTHTFKVLNVDQDKITIDKALYLDAPNTKGRKTAEFTLGEFSKLTKRLDIVPSINNLTHLEKHLKVFNTKLVQELKWPAGDYPPITFNQLPLLIHTHKNPGEFLEITSANDQKITFADGMEMPLSLFLRESKKNGFGIPTAEQMAELEVMEKNKQNDEQANRINGLINKYQKKPEAVTTPNPEANKAEDVPVKPRFFLFRALDNLWANSSFMNAMDIMQIFWKAPIEKIKDKLKDRGERRQAKVQQAVLAGIPYIGNSLSKKAQDVLQGKNEADVKDMIERWEKYSTPPSVLKELYKTSDKLEFKAALKYLAPKGILRFENDPKLHEALNRMFPNVGYPSKKFPQLEGKIVKVGEAVEDVTTLDQIEALLDSDVGYGEGTYESLYRQNNGEYEKKKSEAKGSFRDIEFMYEGGIKRRMQKILNEFAEKGEANSAQYEGYLQAIVSNNEVSPHEGMFFFIAGFGLKSPNSSQSLIPISKLNQYFGEYKENPIYAYFTGNFPPLDEYGTPKTVINEKGEKVPAQKVHLGVNEFRDLYRRILSKDVESSGKTDFSRFTAGRNTLNWLEEDVLTKDKIEKKVADKRNSMDASLFHLAGPLLYETDQWNTLLKKNNYYNSRDNTELLKNCYAGFNDQLRGRARRLKNAKPEEISAFAKSLANQLSGFIYFDSILSGKIGKDEECFRFSDNQYEAKAEADPDGITVGAFAAETREFTYQFAQGLSGMSGEHHLAELATQLYKTNKKGLNDVENSFRKEMRRIINEMAKQKPAELAALAENLSTLMNGMRGVPVAKKKEDKDE